MASEKIRVATYGNPPVSGAVVDLTRDDVTGVRTRLDWTVYSGTLKATLKRPGFPDQSFSTSRSGGTNIPAQYGDPNAESSVDFNWVA